MQKFIDVPHLPKSPVSCVIAGEKYKSILAPELRKYGVELIPMPACGFVRKPLEGHADLCIMHVGENRFVVVKNMKSQLQRIIIRLRASGAHVFETEKELGAEYPLDTILNHCVIGSTVIANTKYADSVVMDFFDNRIHVNQGYAKCSVCVVDEESVITSDAGIAGELSAKGYNVLQIRPGNVDLPGFDTGFIGGAAFKLAEDIIAFCGSIDAHPDRGAIFDFLSSRRIKPVFLTNRPVFDIGSAIPVFENRQ